MRKILFLLKSSLLIPSILWVLTGCTTPAGLQTSTARYYILDSEGSRAELDLVSEPIEERLAAIASNRRENSESAPLVIDDKHPDFQRILNLDGAWASSVYLYVFDSKPSTAMTLARGRITAFEFAKNKPVRAIFRLDNQVKDQSGGFLIVSPSRASRKLVGSRHIAKVEESSVLTRTESCDPRAFLKKHKQESASQPGRWGWCSSVETPLGTLYATEWLDLKNEKGTLGKKSVEEFKGSCRLIWFQDHVLPPLCRSAEDHDVDVKGQGRAQAEYAWGGIRSSAWSATSTGPSLPTAAFWDPARVDEVYVVVNDFRGPNKRRALYRLTGGESIKFEEIYSSAGAPLGGW